MSLERKTVEIPAEDFEQMRAALRAAENALNTAPRFRIPAHGPELGDSYKVASFVSKAHQAADAVEA